jgi:hypothetical protein
LPREHAFFVKTTAINLRAGDDGAATIMGGVRDTDAAWLAAVYLEDVAPYVDAIGLEAGSTNAASLALVEQYDPSSSVGLLGEPLGADPAAGARCFLERHLSVMGTRISGVTYAALPLQRRWLDSVPARNARAGTGWPRREGVGSASHPRRPGRDQ